MAPLGVLTMTEKALVRARGFLASCGETVSAAAQTAVTKQSNELGGVATPVLPHETDASNSQAPDPKGGADAASVDPSRDPGPER